MGNDWWEKIKATVTPLHLVRKNKRIATTVVEETVLDLHGRTVQVAYHDSMEFINTRTGRDILIITGKSGIIRKEFPEWLRLNPRILYWEEQSSGGAFRIRLRA